MDGYVTPKGGFAIAGQGGLTSVLLVRGVCRGRANWVALWHSAKMNAHIVSATEITVNCLTVYLVGLYDVN